MNVTLVIMMPQLIDKQREKYIFEVMWIQDHMEWRYVRKDRGIPTWRPTHDNFYKTGRMAPRTFRKYNERR